VVSKLLSSGAEINAKENVFDALRPHSLTHLRMDRLRFTMLASTVTLELLAFSWTTEQTFIFKIMSIPAHFFSISLLV
jgi:hypothetical protein